MKKKVISIVLVTLMLMSTLVMLAGCGDEEKSKSSSSKSIAEELNEMMDKMEEEGTKNYHVSTVQDYLREHSSYRLIGGGNREIEEAPSTYKNQFTIVELSEQLINACSYVLIYDEDTSKFYTMPIGAQGYKPYFNEEKELSE